MDNVPERVLVRDCDGNYLIRWMIGRDSKVAIITDDNGAEAVTVGAMPQAVVGFPLADVFVVPVGCVANEATEVKATDLLNRFS